MAASQLHQSILDCKQSVENDQTSKLVGWATEYLDAELICSLNVEESLAGVLAEKFGLSFSNEKVQNFAYVLSYAAVIEFAYHVVGVGASFSSVDLTGVALAQIKKSLEDIKKMIGVILAEPLKSAIDKVSTAMNLLQNEEIKLAVEEFKGAKIDAIKAYHYAVGQGKDLDNLRQAVTAKKILILSNLCILSYQEKTETIQPFHILDKKRQNIIAVELERYCTELIDYQKTLNRGVPLLNRSKKSKEISDLTNSLLQIAYPYISEGKHLTCAMDRISPGDDKAIKFDLNLIPEGMEHRTTIKIGTHFEEEKTTFVSCSIWRDQEYVYASNRIPVKTSLNSTEISVSIDLDPLVLETIYNTNEVKIPKNDGTLEFFKIFDKNYGTAYMSVGRERSQTLYLYKLSDNFWYCSSQLGSADLDQCYFQSIPYDDESQEKPLKKIKWRHPSRFSWIDDENNEVIGVSSLSTKQKSELSVRKETEQNEQNLKWMPEQILITHSDQTTFLAHYCLGLYDACYEYSDQTKGIMYVKRSTTCEDCLYLYKEEKGKWYLKESNHHSKLGATTSTKVLRNKTDPDSEVPPTTGWEYCTGWGGNNSWELIQQIEVYCIIKPR